MNPNNWVLVSNLLWFAEERDKVEHHKVQICFSMVQPFKETLCYLPSIILMLKLQCQKKHPPILPFYEAIIFLNARILMEPSLRLIRKPDIERKSANLQVRAINANYHQGNNNQNNIVVNNITIGLVTIMMLICFYWINKIEKYFSPKAQVVLKKAFHKQQYLFMIYFWERKST